MKTLLIVLVSIVAVTCSFSQTQKDRNSNSTLWKAPKACDAINAEKAADNNLGRTSKAIKSTFEDKRETRMRDAVYPILCNPPKTNSGSKSMPVSGSTSTSRRGTSAK